MQWHEYEPSKTSLFVNFRLFNMVGGNFRIILGNLWMICTSAEGCLIWKPFHSPVAKTKCVSDFQQASQHLEPGITKNLVTTKWDTLWVSATISNELRTPWKLDWIGRWNHFSNHEAHGWILSRLLDHMMIQRNLFVRWARLTSRSMMYGTL